MDERLEHMGDYHRKAVEIAATLAGVPGVSVVPDPPQTNMMHVYLEGNKEPLEEAAIAIARETGFWLFHPLIATAIPDHHYFELSAGDATLDLDAHDVRSAFLDLMRRPGAPDGV
jgi:threonine aldolase